MSTTPALTSSLYNGIKEYGRSQQGMYDAIQGLGLFLGAVPLNDIFQDHLNIQDAFQMLPDSMDALADLKKSFSDFGKQDGIVNKLKSIKFDFLSIVLNASVITLDGLTIVAVCGAAKLLDLGKLASGIGAFQIFGVAPLAFVAKIALSPAIRVVYIVVLASSTLVEIRKIAAAKGGHEANRLENRQTRREAQFKIARNVTRIALQVLSLSSLANPALLLGMGAVAAVTGMTQGVMKTNAMRKYFNPDYNPAPTYVPRT